MEIKKTISFDDHFEYNQKTVDMINEKLKSLNLKAAVTTEKDMVKILKFQNVDNFYALKLKPLINFNKILDYFFIKLFGNGYLIDDVIEQEYQCIVKYQK